MAGSAPYVEAAQFAARPAPRPSMGAARLRHRPLSSSSTEGLGWAIRLEDADTKGIRQIVGRLDQVLAVRSKVSHGKGLVGRKRFEEQRAQAIVVGALHQAVACLVECLYALRYAHQIPLLPPPTAAPFLGR